MSCIRGSGRRFFWWHKSHKPLILDLLCCHQPFEQEGQHKRGNKVWREENPFKLYFPSVACERESVCANLLSLHKRRDEGVGGWAS
jgi:hypothetical protein